MAEPGAVSWQFERKGVIAVPRTFDEDQVMEVAIEAGAEDLADEGEHWLVTSAPADLMAVRDGARGGRARAGRLGRADHGAHLDRRGRPTRVEAKKVLRLIEALDDHDDVQNVYANFDIPDAVMAAYEG